jgi:hypothetical protein
MRDHLKLSLLIRRHTIGNTKVSLRNLMHRLMIALLGLSQLFSSLRSCGPLAYSDNERAKQLL